MPRWTTKYVKWIDFHNVCAQQNTELRKYDCLQLRRTRLVKINKKEKSESLPTSFDKQISSEVDFHRYKLKQHSQCEKPQILLDTTERKISGWRLNEVRCVVLNLMLRIIIQSVSWRLSISTINNVFIAYYWFLVFTYHLNEWKGYFYFFVSKVRSSIAFFPMEYYIFYYDFIR